MHETGIYLFCFAGPDAVAPELEGVAVRRFDGCSAVTAGVALEEFSAGHLEDVAWLAPRACRHETVVEAVMRGSAVLPARFGTVFSTADSLARFVDAHRREIRSFLERSAGLEEWGLKALVNSAEVRRPAEHAAASSLPPGKRYLEQKRIRASSPPPALAALECEAAAVAEDLARLASALVSRKPVSEPGRRVLRNWAFLVPRERGGEFRSLAHAAASRHAPKGLEFRVSGPWPPYSFVPELPER